MTDQIEYKALKLAETIYENKFLMEGNSETAASKVLHVYCERNEDGLNSHILLAVNGDLQEVVDRFVDWFGSKRVMLGGFPLTSRRTVICVNDVTIRLIKVLCLRSIPTAYYSTMPKLLLVRDLQKQLLDIIFGFKEQTKSSNIDADYANAFMAFKGCVTYQIASEYRDNS